MKSPPVPRSTPPEYDVDLLAEFVGGRCGLIVRGAVVHDSAHAALLVGVLGDRLLTA